MEDTSALIDELKQSVQNAPVIRREHERASQYLQSVTKRLDALHQRVPADAEAGEFLRQVTQIATEQHVAISNFQPERTADKDGYAEMEVTLTGKGSFESICSFFDRLGKLPRLSKVKNLTLSAGNTPNEYPMKATLLIYFGLQDDAAPRKEVRRG
jgi:Tfp pilus assembly protein PilO